MRKHLPGLAIFIILIISAWLMKTKRWEGKDGQGWIQTRGTARAASGNESGPAECEVRIGSNNLNARF